MIRVDLAAVKPGTRLARPIYNDRGAVWLKAGAELSEKYISMLAARGVGGVYVEEPGTTDVVVNEAISEGARGEATSALADAVGELGFAIDEARKDGAAGLGKWLISDEARKTLRDSVAPTRLSNAAGRIVTDVMAASAQAVLISPKGRDSYVLSHAVDVATTAVAIGKMLFLPRQALIQLARGCLTMDIGLTFVDEAVLNKTTPLSPDERAAIQAHPQLGYELLRRLQPDQILPNTIALQHHERQDGRGYPRGLRGNNKIHLSAFDRERGEISLLAEIAAIADVYDALSSNRPQRPAFPPDQVVSTLRRVAGTHLNRSIVEEFLRRVPVYPVGLAVYVFGQGFAAHRGVVVRVNKDRLDRPIVRVFQNASGRSVEPFELDLAQEQHLTLRSAPIQLAA